MVIRKIRTIAFALQVALITTNPAVAETSIPVTPESGDVAYIPKAAPIRVGGRVAGLTENGSFITEDGIVISQWGVKIGSAPLLSTFLTGKEISCRLIYATSSSVIADCYVFATGKGGVDSSMSLFMWLPDLKWAVYSCDRLRQAQAARKEDTIIWVEDFGYRCAEGGVPIRGAAGD